MSVLAGHPEVSYYWPVLMARVCSLAHPFISLMAKRTCTVRSDTEVKVLTVVTEQHRLMQCIMPCSVESA